VPLRLSQVNLPQVLEVSIQQLQIKPSFNNKVKIHWDIGNSQVILSRFNSPKRLCRFFRDSSSVTSGSHGLELPNIYQYFKSALNGKLPCKVLLPKCPLKLLPKPLSRKPPRKLLLKLLPTPLPTPLPTLLTNPSRKALQC
jgi:hypothetical protein